MIGGGHHLATDSKGNIYIAQTARGHAEAAPRPNPVTPGRRGSAESHDPPFQLTTTEYGAAGPVADGITIKKRPSGATS